MCFMRNFHLLCFTLQNGVAASQSDGGSQTQQQQQQTAPVSQQQTHLQNPQTQQQRQQQHITNQQTQTTDLHQQQQSNNASGLTQLVNLQSAPLEHSIWSATGIGKIASQSFANYQSAREICD